MSHHAFGAENGATLVAGTLRGYRLWNTSWRSSYGRNCAIPLCCATPDPNEPVCPHCGGMETACLWNRELLLSANIPWAAEGSCTRREQLLRGYAWGAGTNTARCTRLTTLYNLYPAAPGHTAPLAECSCGYYGWYTPHGAAEYAQLPVFGAFQAWGRICLGTRGFRAEHVRLEAVASAEEPIRRRLAFTYPGLAVFSSPGQLVEAFGPHDVSQLGVSLPAEEGCLGCVVCTPDQIAGWSPSGVEQVRAYLEGGVRGWRCSRRAQLELERGRIPPGSTPFDGSVTLDSTNSARGWALKGTPRYSRGGALGWFSAGS